MCGIAGAIAISGELDPGVRDALPRMTDVIAHRGPDGHGAFSDQVAGLGHRRLSIIDREGGAQPMGNEDGSVQIVFNGEIYNYRGLRDALKARGHVFRTNSDTETIVHGYEEYGDGVVEKLHGMFAFAIYDARRRRALIARDRLGKKPLFYADLGGMLHFASEMKSIRASPLWTGTRDLSFLESYLSLGYILAPKTAYRDVRKLPPAHYLTVADGRVTVTRYWALQDFDTERRPEEQVLAELDTLLQEAVRERLESEVPLGAFLSGGIDSGLVVSYMAEALPTVTTTSVGFGDAAHNELAAAALSAAHLRTRHFEEQVEPDLDAVLGDIVRAFDEPFSDASAIPTKYVSQLTRTHVTVALSGDGGDEVYGGYSFRYVPHLLEDYARRTARPLALQPAVRALSVVWPSASWVPRPARLKTFLHNIGGSPAEAYYADLCFIKPADAGRLLGLAAGVDHRERETYATVTDIYNRCGSADPVQRSEYADVHTYLANDVLVKVDRMSMLHSLEVRCPLLDHKVVEMGFKIPRRMKLRNLESKHMLRSLARRRLPAELLRLPKHGFTAPVSRWVSSHARILDAEVFSLASPLASLVDVGVARRWLHDHVQGAADRGYALWTLWMLHEWTRIG